MIPYRLFPTSRYRPINYLDLFYLMLPARNYVIKMPLNNKRQLVVNKTLKETV